MQHVMSLEILSTAAQLYKTRSSATAEGLPDALC